ncbi:hypothetical protein O9993_05975 [Vibrio lentus]|nr:hypothetical protein [Vibrio lentus]
MDDITCSQILAMIPVGLKRIFADLASAIDDIKEAGNTNLLGAG